MRFVLIAALMMAASANSASALTCAAYEDLVMKAADHDELARRYLGGWLEGYGGAALTVSTVNQAKGFGGPFCLPMDKDFELTNADLVAMYDKMIAQWTKVDKSDPNQCLAELVIATGIADKYKCR